MFLGATLASHLRLVGNQGFRQRDLKFIIEFMNTWRYSKDQRSRFAQFHNIQVMRYLQDLEDLGWAKVIGRKRPSQYRLTRVGLVGILERLKSLSLVTEFQDFLFIYYLFFEYRERLLGLIEAEGSILPLTQREEISQILNARKLVSDRQVKLKSEIHYWQLRIRETEQASQFVQRELKQQRRLQEVLDEVLDRYPYELNSTKPLKQFLDEIPTELRVTELTRGNRHRTQLVWKGFVDALEFEIRTLDSLGKL